MEQIQEEALVVPRCLVLFQPQAVVKAVMADKTGLVVVAVAVHQVLPIHLVLRIQVDQEIPQV